VARRLPSIVRSMTSSANDVAPDRYYLVMVDGEPYRRVQDASVRILDIDCQTACEVDPGASATGADAHLPPGLARPVLLPKPPRALSTPHQRARSEVRAPPCGTSGSNGTGAAPRRSASRVDHPRYARCRLLAPLKSRHYRSGAVQLPPVSSASANAGRLAGASCVPCVGRRRLLMLSSRPAVNARGRSARWRP
jgi:hypothetical protein